MSATLVEQFSKWTTQPNGCYMLDCELGLRQLDHNSVPLIFCDPPFNIGHKYHEYQDRLSPKVYLDWCEHWLSEIYRVCAPNGSFWLQTGDKFACELNVIAKSCGFFQRADVIWQFGFGQNQRNNFGKCHQHLFYFVKDSKNFVFNDNEIRVPSDRQTKYKDKRANPKGKIPDDVWLISRICGTFKEREKFGCQTPLELLDRIIKVSSNEGDLVVDPMFGSGSCLVSAKQLGRKWLGFDNSAHAYKIATERLEKIQ